MREFFVTSKGSLPPSLCNAGVTAWLIEPAPSDDPEIISAIRNNVVNFWKTQGSNNEDGDAADWENYLSDAPITRFFSKQGFQRGTFAEFNLRPYVTVYGGSGPGTDPFAWVTSSKEASIFQNLAYELGQEIARAGFGLRYGGGEGGIMGWVMRGFMAHIEEHGRQPHQYCVQVVPARFLRKDEASASGSKAKNTVLSSLPDAAIFVSGMPTRYLGLSVGSAGIAWMPGSVGSNAEGYAERTLTKIGVHYKPIAIVNQSFSMSPKRRLGLLMQAVIGEIFHPQQNPAWTKYSMARDGFYAGVRLQDAIVEACSLDTPKPNTRYVKTAPETVQFIQSLSGDPNKKYEENMAAWGHKIPKEYPIYHSSDEGDQIRSLGAAFYANGNTSAPPL